MKPKLAKEKTKEFRACDDALDFIDSLVTKKVKKYGLHHRKIDNSYDNVLWYVNWQEPEKVKEINANIN